MDTCKTCRFWEPTDVFDQRAGFCGHSLVGCKDALPPDGLADGTMFGRVVTGPDFGCIHMVRDWNEATNGTTGTTEATL